MSRNTQLTSQKALWAGRICSGLMIAFLTFDAVIHLARIEPVAQAFARLGLPLNLAVPLGIVELACISAYAYPATSVLGAILLTGYFGGAVAIQLRAGSSLFETLFPVWVGVLVWGGLYVRRPWLRRLMPIRRSPLDPRATSRRMLWTGRIVSVVPALLMLFGAVVKLVKLPSVVEGFRQSGYAEHLVIVVGVIELASVVVFLTPQSRILGAILLTGVLGGAIATNLRIGDAAFIAPAVLGVLIWAGLLLSDRQLRAGAAVREIGAYQKTAGH